MIVEDETTSRRAGFSAAKRALLEKRLRGAGNTASRPVIPRFARRDRVPLSFAQQRLWFLEQLEPGNPFYNLPVALRLRGRLDRVALEKSISAIIARHEALRARFEAEDGSPVQTVITPEAVGFLVVDQAVLPGPQQEADLQRALETEARQAFDLTRGPLLRVTLLKLGETDQVLLLVMHHIISDAWSLEVFFREFGVLYGAFNGGCEISLSELPVQYGDFSAWQRGGAAAEVIGKQLGYWKKQLAGAPQFLELPADRPRPLEQSYRGGHAARPLPKSLADAVKRLAREENATLFLVTLAVFKILLHRLTRQAHVVAGTPVAGRTLGETEGMIGFFVNTLALRTDLSGNPTFRELLARVRQTALDAFANQDLPFERLVEELHPARSAGYSPLVQVLFTTQNDAAKELKLPGLLIEPLKVATHTSKFDLTMGVEEKAGGLLVEAEYATDLFDKTTVDRLLGHYQTLLEAVVADPDRKIGALPLIGETERARILAEGDAKRTGYPRDKTIAQLFEAQVEKTSDAPAILFEQTELTYNELNNRANQLAHHLQKLGAGNGAMVVVCVERSVELIVALLGILKAGGAYVSLEPSQPPERLKAMLANVCPQVVLTQEKFRDRFSEETCGPAAKNLILVCLEKDGPAFASQALANPASEANVTNPAYVSFTSGSTGRPKGVVISQRGVVRLVKEANFARFGADETFLQFAPVAFDASTLEIWGALLNGGRLAIFPPHTPSLTELGEFIRKNKVTTLWLSAGLLHQLVEENVESLRGVRQLLAGGDVLSPAHIRRALEKLSDTTIINGYGPTENTTFTCCHKITVADCERRSIPIGRPVANTQVYVLDEYLQPAPVGVPGELCTGGDGLALGYLNQPELTAEKFIPDPFSEIPGARLYRTGDLVRWLPDGTIEFLGRIDQQVKIRGFRVEPGEIEAALNEHPAIRECVVTTWGDATSNRQLAAYFVTVPTASPTPGELRSHLQRKLPDYMIPAVFMPLDTLPLNGNGKVSRRTLPPPDRQFAPTAQALVAPRDKMEAQLAKIWEEVLGTQRIGIDDHFFDLGGHSLLAVRLVARIEKVLGRTIPVAAIFQAPTVAQLADRIRDKTEKVPTFSIVEIQPRGTKPPLYFVHGVGGGMFWGYTNLSKYLGLDQPVYAFKSRGMDGLEEFDTIEAMAAQYIADLRAQRPHGPYQLGGYCFGGNVAYEMARQLKEQGETISLLALIDCAPPNCSYARFRFTPGAIIKFLRNLGYWVGLFARMERQQRREVLVWKGKALKKRLGRCFRPSKVDVDEVVDLAAQPEDRRDLWEAHVRALIAHRTHAYPGKVTLFRTRGHPMICSFDDELGWREFAGDGVIVKLIPGAHESALGEPHVRTLAEIIRSHLANVENIGLPKEQI